jgi:probable HAF family extracellular repeat protein
VRRLARVPTRTLVAALCACSDQTRPTQPLAAAGAPVAARQPAPGARYTLTTLPSLAGSPSRGNAISNRGWVAGFSSLTNGTRHAALWRGGSVTDLGTLGGPNSSVAWPGLNNHGMVVGIAQTATPDPLGEAWSCSSFLPASGTTCLGFVWEDGVMRPLPTLGGNNGFATAVNNRGQAVGWAETPLRDPTCTAPQVLQFRAVLWEPKRGTTQELPPLPGDSASAATAINARGQVAGISGDCDVAVGRFSARHAVLWTRGTPTEIPNLGGVSWHTPTAINARGDVVGFSNPPGDADGSFIAHAFLWTGTGPARDLGTLPGDETSQAQGINARGQVVGVSCGANGCRAFLWADGVMTDLNTLVGAGFADRLVSARDINDAGEITGDLRETSTGRTVPFVATPHGPRR